MVIKIYGRRNKEKERKKRERFWLKEEARFVRGCTKQTTSAADHSQCMYAYLWWRVTMRRAGDSRHDGDMRTMALGSQKW